MSDGDRSRTAAGGAAGSPPGGEPGGRRWRWHRWLVTGPLFGGLVVGTTTPLLFLVDTWAARAVPPGRLDAGMVFLLTYIGVLAAKWGVLAGLGAGIVCAAITAPVEWHRRPTRRFYTWLAVGVTVPLAALIGVLVHRTTVPGFHPLLFPFVPICVSSLVAYWAGALVGDDGGPATDGPSSPSPSTAGPGATGRGGPEPAR